MKVTLNLPNRIVRELVARAALENVKLEVYVAKVVRSALLQQGVAAAVPKRTPVPVFHRTGAKPIPALSNAKLYAVLDKQDAARQSHQDAT